MSVKIMGIVFEADLPRQQRSVLLAIADHVDANGKGCWASLDRLSYKTGYDRRQVARIVDQLHEDGILVFRGRHTSGTLTWDINKDKIPMLPPFEVWIKLVRAEQEAKDKEKEDRTKCPIQPGQNVLSRQDILSPLDKTFCPTGQDKMSYESDSGEPSVEPSVNHTAVFTAPAPAQNGAAAPDPFSLDIPTNERASVDDEISYGDDDENPETPRTDLERLIVQLCNAKYISEPMRRQLNTASKPMSYRKGKLRSYPSAEDEWKANPDKFAEYVQLCVDIQLGVSGLSPGRSAVIGLIRNYIRRDTGWLDFKDAQHVADAPLVQTEGKYYADPDAPAWMR